MPHDAQSEGTSASTNVKTKDPSTSISKDASAEGVPSSSNVPKSPLHDPSKTSAPKDASAGGTLAPMNEFSIPKDANAEDIPTPKSPMGDSSKFAVPKDVYTEGTPAPPMSKVHSFVPEIDPDFVPDEVNPEGSVSNSVCIKGDPILICSSMHNSKQGYSAAKKLFFSPIVHATRPKLHTVNSFSV